jgi:hypothetical protein
MIRIVWTNRETLYTPCSGADIGHTSKSSTECNDDNGL